MKKNKEYTKFYRDLSTFQNNTLVSKSSTKSLQSLSKTSGLAKIFCSIPIILIKKDGKKVKKNVRRTQYKKKKKKNEQLQKVQKLETLKQNNRKLQLLK